MTTETEEQRKATFKACMKRLSKIPPFRFELELATLEEYWRALDELDSEHLVKAFNRAIRECDRCPSPSQLRRYAVAARVPEPVKAEPFTGWPTEAQKKALDEERPELLRRWKRLSAEVNGTVS